MNKSKHWQFNRIKSIAIKWRDKTKKRVGVNFAVTRIPQAKIQKKSTITIHSRSCRRALDRVKALSEDAVHPANIQRYLSRWASWWFHTTKVKKIELLKRWTYYTKEYEHSLAWLGSGLLIEDTFLHEAALLSIFTLVV